VRVLVTGSNGLLGTKLVGLLLGQAGVQVMGLSRGPRAANGPAAFPFWQTDLTDPSAVDRTMVEAAPDLVVHTAAMTDVDGCEQQPDQAWRINVDATRHVAAGAARIGARLVHLSTEYVFDGRDGPYGEDDPTNPLGVYARSKLASERVAQDVLPGCVIARTTILYGHAPLVRPNFVVWLVAQLRAGREAAVVSDQVGSPTLADNLAEMVWALGRDPGAWGVFNTVGASVLNRFDFARLVARELELDASLLRPIDTASLNQPAPRPLRAGLRTEKFRSRYPEVPVLTAAEGLRVVRAQMASAAGSPSGV
jgi:dTDP-4-dehydrorhamnose reductase